MQKHCVSSDHLTLACGMCGFLRGRRTTIEWCSFNRHDTCWADIMSKSDWQQETLISLDSYEIARVGCLNWCLFYVNGGTPLLVPDFGELVPPNSIDDDVCILSIAVSNVEGANIDCFFFSYNYTLFSIRLFIRDKGFSRQQTFVELDITASTLNYCGTMYQCVSSTIELDISCCCCFFITNGGRCIVS